LLVIVVRRGRDLLLLWWLRLGLLLLLLRLVGVARYLRRDLRRGRGCGERWLRHRRRNMGGRGLWGDRGLHLGLLRDCLCLT
jgi:hypothetical protein